METQTQERPFCGALDDDEHGLLDMVREQGLFLLDPQGRATTWNRGAEKVLGFQPQEIVGEHVATFFVPEDKAAGKPEQALHLATTQGRHDSELWQVRKDGTQFWAGLTISPLKDESGGLRGFAVALRDLSERKQLEEKIQQLQKEQDRRVAERTAELGQAIQALSTPVLPVRDRLLILPLVGVIDSTRGLQFTEQLLTSIRRHRAKAVVVDITGVAVVDSKVANHLLQTVEAARLMGATVIISGISSEIAQTLVRIGVDLSRLQTVCDLRAGLEVAEQIIGLKLVNAS